MGAIDGKSAGTLAPLKGRDGVVGVADEPNEWVDLAADISDEMNRNYREIREHRYGRGSPPAPMRTALVCDELIDAIDLCGSKLSTPVERIVRMGRQTDCRAVVSLLRPDTAEGLSGLARRSLTARLYLGRLEDPQEAEMIFPGRGKRARELAAEAAFPPGRAVGLFGGRLRLVQLPWPGDPPADELLPPKVDKSDVLDVTREPARAAAERAAELHRDGVSDAEIANRMSREGFDTDHGGPWTPADVRRLL